MPRRRAGSTRHRPGRGAAPTVVELAAAAVAAPPLPTRRRADRRARRVCRLGGGGPAADLAAAACPHRGAVIAPCRDDAADRRGRRGDPVARGWPVPARRSTARLPGTNELMIARSEVLRRLVLASHPERAWLAILHAAGGRRARRRRPAVRQQRRRQEHADRVPARLRAGARHRRLRAARGRQPACGRSRSASASRRAAGRCWRPTSRPRDDPGRAHAARRQRYLRPPPVAPGRSPCAASSFRSTSRGPASS